MTEDHRGIKALRDMQKPAQRQSTFILERYAFEHTPLVELRLVLSHKESSFIKGLVMNDRVVYILCHSR